MDHQDTRNKYHPQTHISDILWHFIGPKKFEGFDYERAFCRLESFISDDGTSLVLGPYTADGDFHQRKLFLRKPKIGNETLPDAEEEYFVSEPKALCFCDIPIGSLPIHMSKYGDIGIGVKRGKVNESPFFDKLKPVLYYPHIDEAILRREGETKRFWELFERDVRLADFVKIPTRLGPVGRIDPTDNSELFESIYEEREWRAVEEIKITLDDLAYILVPERSFLSDKFPKLRALVRHGVGLITAKDMYRLRSRGESSLGEQ
ncbi:MAG: hypothetical protein KF681_10970 [Bdellovibrionaceae bacterium]|nr:hypothetical protein [Pseudobdellovibrionaceae bacterium]